MAAACDSDFITSRSPAGKRRPTNVSLPMDQLELAKELGLNISQACAEGLIAAVKRERERRFIEENRAAFEQYNTWVETNGLPAAAYRRGA